MQRRTFLHATLGVIAATAAFPHLSASEPVKSTRIALGLDGHSMRGMKWKAPALINFAAEQKLDAVLLNSLSYFDSIEDAHLLEIKKSLTEHHMQLYIGAGGIAKGAKSFSDKYGDAQALLKTGIRVAKTVGSPIVNVRIGNYEDRYGEGGIEARMAEAIAVLKAMRTQALDANIKFGFENHAGDLRSEELVQIIEEVGKDVCGVMLDPGNAVWAMEDPLQQLQKLAPHVVCTSIRDFMTWEAPEGAMVQWTAVGQGQMDAVNYCKEFARLCPNVPLFVESISNSPRAIPYLNDAFWVGYPKVTARDIRAFLANCRRGQALTVATPPVGTQQKEFDQQHQRKEFLDSIAFLRQHGAAGQKS